MKESAMLLKILNSCNWEKVYTMLKIDSMLSCSCILVCAYIVKTNVIIFTQNEKLLSTCKIKQKETIVEKILNFSLLTKTRLLHIYIICILFEVTNIFQTGLLFLTFNIWYEEYIFSCSLTISISNGKKKVQKIWQHN